MLWSVERQCSDQGAQIAADSTSTSIRQKLRKRRCGNRRSTSDNMPRQHRKFQFEGPAIAIVSASGLLLLGNSHCHPTKITCLGQVGRPLIMRRRDRARLFRLSVLDVAILLTLGVVGMVGLIHWPHLFVAFIAIPIALILLYVILRG
jgi:hypothetical protein